MSLLFSTESTVFHYALSCPVVLCCAISLYSFLFQLMLKIILMDLWSLYALNRSQAIEHNMPAKNATTANEPEYGWRMHGLCSNVHPHEFECMFITFVVCIYMHAMHQYSTPHPEPYFHTLRFNVSTYMAHIYRCFQN